MPDVTARSPKVFDSIGKCIYCGATDGLTREHVLPIGLGGGLILPDASCPRCSKITCKIENDCMRKMLLPYRLFANMVRRRNNLPTHIPLILDTMDHKEFTIRTEIHPKIIALPEITQYAGFLRKSPIGERFSVKYKIFSHDDDSNKTFRHLQINKNAIVNVDMYSYARMLAKIAHASLVGIIGLNAFEPFLPPLILGDNNALGPYLIGRSIRSVWNPDRIPVHQIGYFSFHFDNSMYVAVDLRMFADLGDESPMYTIIAGKLTSEATP